MNHHESESDGRTNSVNQGEGREIILRVAAAGDKSNDKVRFCYVCRDRGYPHEAVDFQKIPGRMLGDGKRETVGWIVKDYITGNMHVHKQRRP
jgi:hypothetical protein